MPFAGRAWPLAVAGHAPVRPHSLTAPAGPVASFSLVRRAGPPCPAFAALPSWSLRCFPAPPPPPRFRGGPQPLREKRTGVQPAPLFSLRPARPQRHPWPLDPGPAVAGSCPFAGGLPAPRRSVRASLPGATLAAYPAPGPPPANVRPRIYEEEETVSPLPSPQGERGNGRGETVSRRNPRNRLTLPAHKIYTHLTMSGRRPWFLFVAPVLVVVATGLFGCRHAFQCRGELTPAASPSTLPDTRSNRHAVQVRPDDRSDRPHRRPRR